jgi:anti-anti-sigma factor
MQIDPLSNQDWFGVTVRESGAETIVKLAGELDLATAGTLREVLSMLELDGGINLAIDLRGLSFLGSTGMGILVAACKRVRAGGGSFSVWCDDGLTRGTLEIAGLVVYLELHDGEEEHPNQRVASIVNDARMDGLTA